MQRSLNHIRRRRLARNSYLALVRRISLFRREGGAGMRVVKKSFQRRLSYEPPAPVGTRYCVHTATDTFEVAETGEHWTPGTPIPEGAHPNPLLALARCAEVAAQKGVYAPEREERRAA